MTMGERLCDVAADMVDVALEGQADRVVLVYIKEPAGDAFAAGGDALSDPTVRKDIVKLLRTVIAKIEGN
jgi:hypothetical protein